MPLTGTFRFASAISDQDVTAEAIDEAAGEAAEAIGDGASGLDLAIVFASYHHRDGFAAIADRVSHRLGPRVALAVTAAGVLGSGRELEGRPGISVLLARMPGAWLRPFCYEDLDWAAVREDPIAMRRAMLGDCDTPEHGDPVSMLLFADPFSVPMVKLMPMLNQSLGGVPIVGGIASGGREAGDNRLLLNARLMRQGAVGVVIGGAVRVDCTVSQGCRPIGAPFVITQARHNIIQQIGGKPAMAVVQQLADSLDPDDQHLLKNGLFVGRVIDEYKERFGRGDFLVRNIIGADQQHGYIAVSDLVKVGQTIQFHVRDRHTAEEDLRMLLQGQQLHGPAAGAIVCTCNGRGRNLFETPDLESSIIAQSLDHPPTAGFFAAGEIGPVGDENFLHGFTSSMAVFRPVAAD